MLAISLHQYWASLMDVGEKKNETRSQRTKVRGRVAIHASKIIPAYVRDAYRESEVVRSTLFRHFGIRHEFELEKLPRGKILCTVDLVDCLRTDSALFPGRHFLPGPETTEFAFGNYSPGRFALITKDVIRVDPISVKGSQLLFWEIPPEVVRELERQGAV